jgi:Xaa-Pro aminopeptidase
MRTIYDSRLEKTRRAMAALRTDALVITHLPNVFYLCGFTGSSAALVVEPDSLQLFTDGRYTIQAREEAPGAALHIGRAPVAEQSGEYLRARVRKGRLAAAFEAGHVTVREWTRLREAGGSRVRWKQAEGLVEGLREVKEPGELDVMRQAAKLGSEVMTEVFELVRPGVRELDLAAEIDYRMRRKGASGPSFETIVGSGVRSALPHAQPSEKRLGKKELVVFDLGVILRHYCCDLTRTVCLGRAPAEVRRWYKAVEDAQRAALEALRAGATAGQVDRAARRVLERRSLGRYFVHSTGHGLGIEIHETPRLGRAQAQEIRVGNVVTLEPGVYVDGVGGIRIEDEVAVHASGTEVLTSAPRGLLEL